MSERIAVVTGSNKGIGLEIVRCLCRHFGKDGVVYLTARDEGRGLAAMELLQKEGLSPKFHSLDVTDQGSIDRIRDHLRETHGGIDNLVNNAGFGAPQSWTQYERAWRPMPVNFTGLLAVSRALIPLVRSGGRVVNLSSTTANHVFRDLGMNEDLKTRFRQVASETDVENLMDEFLKSSKRGSNKQDGWPEWGYGISKLGVVVLTKVQARDIQMDMTRRNILINTCCPGFVLTDMSSDLVDSHYGGTRVSTVEGADTPTYLALLPPDHTQPHGQFVLRRQVHDFINNDYFIQI